MSYVDAFVDKEKDIIHVVERVDGKRVYRDYPAEYTFYYSDPKGKYQTIYRTPVSKFTTRSNKEFRREVKMQSNKTLWESDFKPVFRCFENNYLGKDAPKLHTCYWDIETNFDLAKGGYAPVEDPFNNITAISLYLDWQDKLITLAMPPTSVSMETALEIASQYTDCYMFEKEADLLDTFLHLIEDSDIMSGWNDEGFDIPYTVGRISRVLSKNDLRRLCLWEQMPKKREYERFGKKSITYDLVGRVNLDYMQLYRKFTYEERHSYSLDAIGEYELNERKEAYEGSLDQLYNKDFDKFIKYSRQDVRLLANLNKKLGFMDLANAVAHDSTVLLRTIMGTVAATDQSVTNEAHKLGFIVPDKKRRVSDDELDDDDHSGQAAGAYVAYPKKGMHKSIGAIDINSLYPSAIRALNMSPETIVAQCRPIMTEKYINDKMASGCSFAAAWEGLFGSLEYTAIMNMEPGTEITIDWEESGEPTTHSAEEVWNIIFEGNQKWMISANGTIFRYDITGIIPGVLSKWLSERKLLQRKKKEAESFLSGLTISPEFAAALRVELGESK